MYGNDDGPRCDRTEDKNCCVNCVNDDGCDDVRCGDGGGGGDMVVIPVTEF